MLLKIAAKNELVLIDYETNGQVEFRDKPLSHAWLLKYFLENSYPKF